MDIFPPKKIKVVEMAVKGMGVVATEDIKAGETIEVCPVVFISKQETEFFEKEKTPLKFYYLIQTDTNQFCVMLGYGSIYNHSLTPNADIEYNDQKAERYVFFKALKDIKTGEEIVFDYEFDDNVVEYLKQD